MPAPWDPKTRKSAPDAALIEAMVRTVNQAPDQDFVREVSRYIDLKQFVVYLATETFLSDYDGFLGRVFGMNNLYWYRFAGGDGFVLIPWDKDGAFDWAGTAIFEGVEENVLARRALQVPELRQLYLASLICVKLWVRWRGGLAPRESSAPLCGPAGGRSLPGGHPLSVSLCSKRRR